jgi:cytoskeletal protein CcmA (bactofilin family)
VSCPGEAVLARYADRELHGDALHALESHLVGCRDCRSRVVALQSESLWLADVLRERERRHALHAADEPTREPGVAMGLPLAIAGATAVVAVGGALLESHLPGGLDVLNPMRLLGVTDMAFDLVFMLRARAPGLLELAFAVAIVASVSALLSFAAGALYRRVFGAAAVLLCLLAPFRGGAFELRHVHHGDVRIEAGQTENGALVVSSETFELDGVVDGDLFVAADRVSIAGEVRGNVYAFARNFELSGRVTGSLVGLIETTEIDGKLDGTLYALSDRVRLAPEGRVARDLAAISNDVVLAGAVGRDVFFGGERLELRGAVGRNVEARWRVERLALRDGARIGGDLDAWLARPEALERAPGAQVAGAVRPHEVESARQRYLDIYRDPWFWTLHAVGFVAAFLFGLLVYRLAPRLLAFDVSTAREFFGALGRGFVVLVVTPVALALLALTLVGIPIAVLGFFALLTSIYLAEIVVACAVGRWLAPPKTPSLFDFGRSLLVGLAALVVAEHIPFVGVPVTAVALLVGLGAVAARARAALGARPLLAD